MTDHEYAASLERQLTAARAELATLRADLERAVRDRGVLLAACKEGLSMLSVAVESSLDFPEDVRAEIVRNHYGLNILKTAIASATA